MYTPDNYDKWASHDAEQEKQLNRLPECANCGESITADHFFEIEGVQVCPDCMDSDYRRNTDEYIE